MHDDLIVLGAGPAGLAVARAAGRLGMKVTCVDPAPDAPWARTFGTWRDEIAPIDDLACIEAVFDRPTVHLGEAEPRVLDRVYCRLDAPALQRRLLETTSAVGVRLVPGRASAVLPSPAETRVELAGGGALAADVVIDATGNGAHVRRVDAREAGFQAAFGRLVEVEGHGFGEGEMSLMDWRPLPGDAPHDAPTFLYALPLGPRRLFVEETSLVGRPALGFERLSARLAARLAAMGIRVVDVLDEERCLIAMGSSLPRRDQAVLSFGAAAGMVHPATGYQLARALAAAPLVARALAGDGSRRARVRRAYDALWSDDRRRAWELYTFGMETLLSFDARAMRTFFRGFFDLPSEAWRPYLDGTASAAEVSVTMLRVLARVEGRARRELVRVDAKRGRALLRALGVGLE